MSLMKRWSAIAAGSMVLASATTLAVAQDGVATSEGAPAATVRVAQVPKDVRDDRWAIVPQLGVIFSDSSDLDAGLSLGLRLQKPLTDRVALDLGVDYANLETTRAGDYERVSGRIGGLLFLGKPFYDRASDFQPFVGGGAHLSQLDFIGQSVGAYGVYGTLGFLQRFSAHLSGSIEARYQIDDVQDKGPIVDETFYTWQLMAGLRFALGTKPVDPDGDDDLDGVPNSIDRCPNTPLNTPVDVFGCPLDSDGDGVLDRDDLCPNTPRGVEVDVRGCPLDSDGDGVPDYLDLCPGTPPGVKVDANGCPFDSDGDGVPDHLDECPGTPPGVRVDARGCPFTDSDGDGIPDYLDKCPNTPAGIPVDADGCPLDSDGDGIPDYLDECPNTPPGLAVLPDGCALVGDCRRPRPGEEVDERGCAVDRSFILRGVQFEFDSAVLTAGAKQILDRVSETLKAYADVNVELEGHTDNIGSAAYNLGLSERRSIAVKEYLVSRGVQAQRMTPVGYGLTQPIADNSTEAGRDENRRVELTVR